MEEEDDIFNFMKAYDMHMAEAHPSSPSSFKSPPKDYAPDIDFGLPTPNFVDLSNTSSTLYGLNSDPAWVDKDLIKGGQQSFRDQKAVGYLNFLKDSFAPQDPQIQSIVDEIKALPENIAEEIEIDEVPDELTPEEAEDEKTFLANYLKSTDSTTPMLANMLKQAEEANIKDIAKSRATIKDVEAFADEGMGKAVDEAAEKGMDISQEMARSAQSAEEARPSSSVDIPKDKKGLQWSDDMTAGATALGGDLIHMAAMTSERDTVGRDLAGYGSGLGQIGVGIGLAASGAGLPLALPLMAGGIKKLFTYGAKDHAEKEARENEEAKRHEFLKAHSAQNVQIRPGYLKNI